MKTEITVLTELKKELENSKSESEKRLLISMVKQVDVIIDFYNSHPKYEELEVTGAFWVAKFATKTPVSIYKFGNSFGFFANPMPDKGGSINIEGSFPIDISDNAPIAFIGEFNNTMDIDKLIATGEFIEVLDER
jgi:hypothetical protein